MALESVPAAQQGSIALTCPLCQSIQALHNLMHTGADACKGLLASADKTYASCVHNDEAVPAKLNKVARAIGN